MQPQRWPRHLRPGRTAKAAFIVTLVAGLLLLIFAVGVAVVARFWWRDPWFRPHLALSVSEIVRRPERYRGTRVTVRHQIARVISPNAITIGGSGFLGAGDELLVVTSRPLALVLSRPELSDDALTALEGSGVQVSGMLLLDDWSTVAAQFDIDLDTDAFAAFAGGPVLVGSALALLPPVSIPPEQVHLLPLAAISEAPHAYLDSVIRTRGMITAVESPVAFVLDATLLVVSPIPLGGAMSVGTAVEVTGDLRAFRRSEFADELALELDADSLDRWDGRPAILLTAAEPR